MKKILAYILISIVINTTLMSVSVLANSANSQENFDNNERVLIAVREYQPAIIDKPETLPGPSQADQQEANETAAKNTDSNSPPSPLITMLTQKLLPKATTGLIGFVGITAFIMLIVSGVRFVTAYGNDEAVTKAKTEAIYAVVGLVLSLLAYTIVIIIANIEIKP